MGRATRDGASSGNRQGQPEPRPPIHSTPPRAPLKCSTGQFAGKQVRVELKRGQKAVTPLLAPAPVPTRFLELFYEAGGGGMGVSPMRRSAIHRSVTAQACVVSPLAFSSSSICAFVGEGRFQGRGRGKALAFLVRGWRVVCV
jgi:hypothetical protein